MRVLLFKKFKNYKEIKVMRKFLIMLMVVAMASFLFVGCLPGVTPDPDPDEDVAVTGVTLVPATLAFTVGDAPVMLAAIVAPEDATDTSVTWTSTDRRVAIVAAGVVTPLNAGISAITATTVDGGFGATCVVTVTEADEPAPEPELALVGIAVDPEEMDLFKGESVDIAEEISVTATYEIRGFDVDVDLKDCFFLTKNSKVATVKKVVSAEDTTVTVTAVGVGIADILVEYEGKFATLAITVVAVELEKIVVLPEEMPLFVGDYDTITSVTAHYSDETKDEIYFGDCDYKSSDTDVVVVGKIFSEVSIWARKAGTADITVSYTEGGITKTDIVEVTVSAVEPDPEPEPNQAPVITSAAITSGTVGEEYIYEVIATDSDGDTLTYSLTEGPLDMTIGETTGVISWTPAGAGRFDVGVKVADPDELFDVQDFKITVTAPTLIDIADITGVTAPVTGATLDTEITATVQYTGAITWATEAVPGTPVTGVFLGDTVYIATITLSPKAGYTLTGVEAGFFTVDGETPAVLNVANSGVVTTVAFTATAATISLLDIAGVTAAGVPVAGESLVDAITDTDEYEGTVEWDPAHEIFAAGEYKATITLTAEPGFTLFGVEADSFLVTGAVATNLINAGVVTAIFTCPE
ncbi:hypothetical protein ES705_21219 [subsurface metagenome]